MNSKRSKPNTNNCAYDQSARKKKVTEKNASKCDDQLKIISFREETNQGCGDEVLSDHRTD